MILLCVDGYKLNAQHCRFIRCVYCACLKYVCIPISKREKSSGVEVEKEIRSQFHITNMAKKEEFDKIILNIF